MALIGETRRRRDFRDKALGLPQRARSAGQSPARKAFDQRYTAYVREHAAEVPRLCPTIVPHPVRRQSCAHWQNLHRVER